MLLLAIISLNTAMAVATTTASAENNQTNAVGCNENGDCPSSVMDCNKICGCDRAVYYNETSKTCVVSFKNLMISQLKVYGNDKDDSESNSADTMAEKIRVEAERIFNTILVSVILFLTCCAICFISACLYCCRISYSDYRLNNDVKALTKKLKRDHIKINPSKKSTKKPSEPASESCNVICQDAGLFVV